MDRPTLNYDLMSADHWTIPADSLSFIGTFDGMFDVGEETYFAGDYLDSSFNVRVGHWDVTGHWLGSTLAASTFADLGYVEDE